MNAPPLMECLREEFRAGEPASSNSISLVDDTYFDILDPSTWVFNITTIARSLSNLCRFNGHLKSFYSVAEHAVRVCKTLSDWGEGEHVQFLGLHHDDIESIIGDIPSPHKGLFSVDGEPIRVLEKNLEYAYLSTFDIYFSDEDWGVVKSADLFVYLMERSERPSPGMSLPPQEAYEQYLYIHNYLARQLLLEEEPTPF